MHPTRRCCLKLAAALAVPRPTRAATPLAASLFDGRTLDGWIQIENSATSLSASAVTNPQGFLDKLTRASDPVSTYLRTRLTDPQAPLAAMVKQLNGLIDGPSLYDSSRFANISIRPETRELLNENPQGYRLARLNKLLLEDAYPSDLIKAAVAGWIVKDGAMASTGAGRGVIYTARDFARFKLSFTMRHVSGKPDHQACVLIFCTRPKANEKPLDALGGIQLQPPNGGHWDYRPGKNNNGGEEFTLLKKPGFDPHVWSRVEITADAATGEARMSVAQPVDSAPVEVLAFKDSSAGKPGPIAWQMHNAGLFDEYKDVTLAPA